MKRVEANADWSLFCPSEAPGLNMVHSEEFEELYIKYEREGRARSTIPSAKLWQAILTAQIETGGPFMLYKDAANSELLIAQRYIVNGLFSQVEPAKLRDDPGNQSLCRNR